MTKQKKQSQQDFAVKWVTGRILRETSVSQEFRSGQQVRSASGRGVVPSGLPVTDSRLPVTRPAATRTSREGTLAQTNRKADSRDGAIFSRFPRFGSDRPRCVGLPRAGHVGLR